uniref:Arp2/3 complex 34 kDa subunit n=1 Tax=Echinococcus granulosus TaxID=6210 RepID=A0A068X4Z9_ECHGR|nr:hypothetical protein EgrG_002052400 [Echinococcus granulosus]
MFSPNLCHIFHHSEAAELVHKFYMGIVIEQQEEAIIRVPDLMSSKADESAIEGFLVQLKHFLKRYANLSESGCLERILQYQMLQVEVT